MSIVEKILRKFRGYLRHSAHIHIREENVNDLGDLVDLLDRFVDGNITYPLEWGDFIDWRHDDPCIEQIRKRIEASEALLFSREQEDRTEYVAMLIEERNKVAASIGRPTRKEDPLSIGGEPPLP